MHTVAKSQSQSYTYNPIAVEICLDLTLAPRIKNVVLGCLCSLGQERSSCGVVRTADLGCGVVVRLGCLDQILSSGTRTLCYFLSGLVARGGQVAPEVIIRQVVERPC